MLTVGWPRPSCLECLGWGTQSALQSWAVCPEIHKNQAPGSISSLFLWLSFMPVHLLLCFLLPSIPSLTGLLIHWLPWVTTQLPSFFSVIHLQSPSFDAELGCLFHNFLLGDTGWPCSHNSTYGETDSKISTQKERNRKETPTTTMRAWHQEARATHHGSGAFVGIDPRGVPPDINNNSSSNSYQPGRDADVNDDNHNLAGVVVREDLSRKCCPFGALNGRLCHGVECSGATQHQR